MLNYLARSGIIPPSLSTNPGRGRKRKYSFTDVVMLRALNRLLSKGISVARLKEALKQLNAYKVISPTTLSEKFLVTDGNTLYWKKDETTLLQLHDDGQFAFAFIIDIETIRNEVLEEADRMGLSRATK